MAITVQDVINRALRRLGRLGVDSVPSVNESTQALETLKAIYQRFIIEGFTGSLRDVIVTATSYTASENERVFLDSGVTPTVDLPETVANTRNYAAMDDYGDGRVTVTGVDGEYRMPRDLAVVSINDKAQLLTEDFVYDASRKQWFGITTLALTDEAPLSHRDANGLSSLLAVELSDEYGLPIGDVTVRSAIRFQAHLTHNYSQGGEAVTPPSYY